MRLQNTCTVGCAKKTAESVFKFRISLYWETPLYRTPSIPDSLFTGLSLYRTPSIPDSLYTRLPLYRTFSMQDSLYSRLPLYRTPSIPDSLYTRLPLYQTPSIPGSLYTRLPLYWTPSILDSLYTKLPLYQTPSILDSLYTRLPLYWTPSILDYSPLPNMSSGSNSTYSLTNKHKRIPFKPTVMSGPEGVWLERFHSIFPCLGFIGSKSSWQVSDNMCLCNCLEMWFHQPL